MNLFPATDYVISVRHLVAATNRFVGDRLLPANNNGGVWVASISIGGEVNDADQAHLGLEQTSKILYVVAAGNAEGSNRRIGANYVYPKFNGALSNLLVVGALNSKGRLATYSRVSNTNVDLFAQGSCVCGARGKSEGDNELQLYGTSQAAPLAATAATILADGYPTWSAQQIKWRLISTTDFQDDLYQSGIGGRLNLGAALDYRSRLIRLPTHRSMVDKATYYISKNQQVQLSGVEKNSSGWHTLLDGPTQVLRLQRIKSCSKGYSCFRRILFEGNSDVVSVEESAELPYTDKNNNKINDLQAEDLVDVSFTFDYSN
jgi:hypothetical protein